LPRALLVFDGSGDPMAREADWRVLAAIAPAFLDGSDEGRTPFLIVLAS